MTNLQPKFSIITVCRNAEETIENTFKSIFAQSYKNYETIVIDGKSTDNTLNIIEKYKNQISKVVSESDTGIYNAMNKALNLASGSYLFFLNANDSFYECDVLEKVAEVLTANPNIDFLYGDANYISKDGKIKTLTRFNNFVIKSYNFISLMNINHQTIFYKKDLFETFGEYDENIKLLADWDFNIRCLYKTKTLTKYVPIVISNYQLGGLSNNKSMQDVLEKDKILVKTNANKKNTILDKIFIKLDSYLYWHFEFARKFLNPKRILWWQYW